MSILAVAVRRERGTALFRYARDYRLFLSRLVEAANDCEVHQLTVLPRGFVMVATPRESRAIARLVAGTLGAPADLEIESRAVAPGRLGRLTVYNDNLPYRLGRVPDPARYRWSTASAHAGQGAAPAWWTPSPWYLALGACARERAVAYADALGRFRATALGRREIPRAVDPEPAPEGTEIGTARLPFRIGLA